MSADIGVQQESVDTANFSEEDLEYGKQLYALTAKVLNLLKPRLSDLDVFSSDYHQLEPTFSSAKKLYYEIIATVEGFVPTEMAKTFNDQGVDLIDSAASVEGGSAKVLDGRRSRVNSLKFHTSSLFDWKAVADYQFLTTGECRFSLVAPLIDTNFKKPKTRATIIDWAIRLHDIGVKAKPVLNETNPAERSCWQAFWSGLSALFNSLFSCLKRKKSTPALLLKVHENVTQPAQDVLNACD